MNRTVHLLISVDTEEDQWRAAGRKATVENSAELPRFQAFAEDLGLRPTYFANYPMATDAGAAAILADLAERGAEIGVHVHPWNTPPFEEDLTGRNTMLCNLPAPLQHAKIASVRDALSTTLGVAPTSFRAGRFGLGSETVGALIANGFDVDSSVTPYFDWEAHDQGPSFDGAPLKPYRLDASGDPRVPVQDGRIREIPVSCGFTRGNFSALQRIHRSLGRSGGSVATGALSRLGLVRKVFGSPEPEEARDLVALARRIVDSGLDYLHLMLHSSSLLPGLTPFTPDAQSRDRLYVRLRKFVEAVDSFARIEPATVSEYARHALD